MPTRSNRGRGEVAAMKGGMVRCESVTGTSGHTNRRDHGPGLLKELPGIAVVPAVSADIAMWGLHFALRTLTVSHGTAR